MRIVFMGTPDFAVPSLEKLAETGHEIAGVFTQPDRPKGRGNKLTPSPVKIRAMEYGIPVFQPERIRRDGVEDLKKLKPELCVTAAFGQILSQEILDIPPMGNINVHASLLPRHRGSAPIAWAILQGDSSAGVTTMMMDRGIDTGDMLLRAETEIGETETCGELTEWAGTQGWPAFRGKQIFRWIHAGQDFDAMSNLPRDIRQYLTENCVIGMKYSCKELSF